MTVTNASGSYPSNNIIISAYQINTPIPIIIYGSSSGAVTNYPVMITLWNTAGTNSGSNIYLGGLNRDDSNWNDIWFNLSSSATEDINHWTETNTGNATSQNVWIDVPSIPFGSANSTTIYLNCGNFTQNDSSNGKNTFPLFDDFGGSSINSTLWTTATGTISVSGGYASLSNSATVTAQGLKSGSTFGQGYALRSRAAINGVGASALWFPEIGFDAWGSNAVSVNPMISGAGSSNTSYVSAYNGGVNSYAGIGTMNTSYHVYDLLWQNSSSIAGRMDNNVTWAYVTTNIPASGTSLPVTIRPYTSSGSSPTFPVTSANWIFVRPYINPEPTLTSSILSYQIIPYPPGQFSSTWNLSTDQVLLPGGSGAFDQSAVEPDAILNVNGTYRAYYTGQSSGNIFSIGYANSSDLNTWVKQGQVFTGSGTGVETNGVSQTKWTALPGGGYRVFYHSVNLGSGSPDQAETATTTDGITFTPSAGNPIFTTQSETYYSVRVDPEAPIYYNGTWSVLFGAYNGTNFTVGLAQTSDYNATNGWTITPNPVFTPSISGWDNVNVYPDTTRIINNTVYMFYQGNNQYADVGGGGVWQVGIATSPITDLHNWTRIPTNPVGIANSYWAYGPQDPTAPIILPNQTAYYSWFAGSFDSAGTSYGAGWMTTPFYTENGTISPNTTQSVVRGDNKTFLIIPYIGYQISNVIIDGSPIGAVSSYTFSNVTTSHSISATFNQTPSYGTIITNFTANQTIGYQYAMPVQFTDTSTDTPTTWNWSFGDTYWQNGTTQNPIHYYSVAGNYDVALYNNNTVTSNSTIKTNYINLTTDDDIYLTSRLHMNGNAASSVFMDEKGLEWTAANGAITTTSTSEFGGSSGDFTPALSQITSPSQSAFDFGTGPFTIEMWVNPTSTMASSQIIARTSMSGLTDGWGLYQTTGALSNTWHFYLNNATSGSTSAFTIPLNSWSSVVATRDNSGNLKVYVNGTLAATATGLSGNYDTNNPVTIGSYGMLNTYTGYIDEVSISKIQRWTTNFTPQWAEYRGNLYQNYVNINPDATLRYKSDPSSGVTIGNQTNGGVRIRTMQIQNVTNATSVFGQMTYDPLHIMVLNVTLNSSTYNDLILSSSSIDNVQGLITFNVTRTAGMQSLFLNRTSILNAGMLYYNYSLTNSDTQAFANGNLIDGQHNVTYPIFYYIDTPVYFEPWENPVINISTSTTTPAQYASVQFNDNSTNYPNAWGWDFGDGDTSTLQNPTHAYTAIGNYSVTLHAYQYANTSITNTTTFTDYIAVMAAPPPAPVASFTATPTTVTVNSPVQFNDTSQNTPTSWLWNFGDSSGSSSQNPAHVYTSIGNYTVSLKATNAQGNDTATYTNYITVQALAPPVASFTSNVSSGQPPLTVQFTDTSSNIPTSWSWKCDGTQFSTVQNPVYTFTTAGNYTVNLTAFNAAGNSTVTHYINLTTLSGFNRQDLYMDQQYTLTVTFVDSATGNVIPVVSVSDSNGYNTTTTNGIFTHTYPYSAVVIYATSTGYSLKDQSYIINRDRTETIQMIASSTQSQNTNIIYTQQQTRFIIMNSYSNRIVGAGISASYVSSSLPSDSLTMLEQAFGISENVATLMINSSVAMDGTTGSDGSLTFMMFPSLTYNLTITNVPDEPWYISVSPRETEYTIHQPTANATTSYSNTLNTQITFSEPNNSYIRFNATFQDLSGSTTNVKYYVVNTTNNNAIMCYADFGNPGTSAIINTSCVVPNVRGVQYWAYFNKTT
jgi:PKD repeat protein